MDEILSPADIKQQYYRNIVLYKGKVVLVTNCYDDKVEILYLITQKKDIVLFNRQDFKANTGRLGNINYSGFVFNVERVPSRVMQIGYSRQNLSFQMLQVKRRDGDYMDAFDDLSRLSCKELAYTIEGKYPTFSKGLNIVKKDNKKIMAFDRQFAVDGEGNIYYKIYRVGNVSLDADTEEAISFISGKKYLKLLLGNNYENPSAIL